MAFTEFLNLEKPTVGANRDTWGMVLNDDLDTIDQLLYMAMPVGCILDYAGSTPPAGWLVADGRLVSRVTYSALFAVLGTTWSAGDGSTTFGLPNLVGRSGVGPGTVIDEQGNSVVFSLAQARGNVYNAITQAVLPNVTLTSDAQGYHNHSGPTTPAGGHNHITDVQGYHNHAVSDPGHTHGVSDPSHSHYFNDYVTGGSGSIAGGTGYSAFATTGNNTASATTGISIGASGTGLTLAADGAHAHSTSAVGDHQHYIQWDGNHSHNISLGGGGGLFQVLSPVLVCSKIIYAGTQAAMRSAAAAAAPGSFDELTAIREELAQLRALVMPQRRRLSAPMRGSH